MLIKRTSMLTGITRTRDLDITHEQVLEWENGALIQNVMSNLSDDDREFFLTGATAEEWDEAFPEDEDFEPEWDIEEE